MAATRFASSGGSVLRAVAVAGLVVALAGCAFLDAPIMDPKGPIALAERDILFRAIAIMLIVVIPVFVLAFWFSWRYRASRKGERYDAQWESERVDAVTWIIPTAIVVSLAIHVWIYTHILDPYKPLQSSVAPLEVEVVAQDWKWLFVYPDRGVASVNELAFPAGVPLRLKITSDTVMNSFFIPALGGQIYAMAGMQTELNLLADAPGRFVGRNTQYSGDGFPDQHFTALAMTVAEFDAWVASAQNSPQALDAAAYAALAEPSIAHPVAYYSGVEPGFFQRIIAKYTGGSTAHDMAAH